MRTRKFRLIRPSMAYTAVKEEECLLERDFPVGKFHSCIRSLTAVDFGDYSRKPNVHSDGSCTLR